MRTSRAVLGFCLAVAVIAAAIADPLIEFASNIGWFGPGSFTDHSNLDVVPALLGGVVVLALFMVRKGEVVLAGDALPDRCLLLLPSVFALQMLTLYVMETLEQFVAFGHVFGPTIWLGAPPPISLAVHVATCAAVTYAIVRSRRMLAATTLRVVRLIVAIATYAANPGLPIAVRRFTSVRLIGFLPLLCTIGERAPPRIAR